MRPKLKEEPKEWLKFTIATSVALSALATMLWIRKICATPVLISAIVFLALADLLCLARPAWFRSFYRGGMTVGFHIGQIVGRILLSAIFLLVLTPLGLILRLFGKDLLKTTKPPHATSYWQSARPNDRFDRQF